MKVLVALAAACLAACANAPSTRVADVAPAGSLRVAIGVGPSPSAFWAVKDPSTGEPKGVTVELGKAAAARLGVPLQLVQYPNSGEITAAAGKGAWDMSFMPQDPAREKLIDPGPAYVTYVTTYIVRAGSTIRNARDVDQPGVRVGGVEGTATSRALARTLKQAKLVLFKDAEEAQAQLAQGKLDALAQGREALLDFAKKARGTRVLDEPIVSTSVIVVVPKDRPATRAWAARFLEEAKADGTVRRALDSAGFKDAAVAPPAK